MKRLFVNCGKNFLIRYGKLVYRLKFLGRVRMIREIKSESTWIGNSRIFAVLMSSVLLLLADCSCASSSGKQTQNKYSRLGESLTTSYSNRAISNAIVSWAYTLTNGYVLYGDKDARLYHRDLISDKAILYELKSHISALEALWGTSACLPSPNSKYSADIIIRIT